MRPGIPRISGSALAVHQIPYMSDKGFTGAQITLIVMLIGLCSVAATFLWGFLAERFPLRHLMAACLLVHAGGILILVAARSLPALVLFALVVGLSRAGGLWIGRAYANYFGRRVLGGLRGVIAPTQAGTSAFSVMFAGVVYDATGSYTPWPSRSSRASPWWRPWSWPRPNRPGALMPSLRRPRPRH